MDTSKSLTHLNLYDDAIEEGALSDSPSFSIGQIPGDLAAVIGSARAGASAFSCAGEARQAARRVLGSGSSGVDSSPPDALPFLTTVYGVLTGESGMAPGERYLGEAVNGRSRDVGRSSTRRNAP